MSTNPHFPSSPETSGALVEFFKWAMREGPWDGGDLDGASVQDKAEELGLIVKTQYDAEKHGVQSDFEHGDDWFEYSPDLLGHAYTSPAPADCDWPNEPFKFLDDPGEHDPCYVVMPGGAMLSLNHHAAPGVDIARAKFIVDACNMVLSPDFPRAAVAEAMRDAWNTICSDTGCHPLDIKHQGKELFFEPGHWVDLIALFLGRTPSVSSTLRPSPDAPYASILVRRPPE